MDVNKTHNYLSIIFNCLILKNYTWLILCFMVYFFLRKWFYFVLIILELQNNSNFFFFLFKNTQLINVNLINGLFFIHPICIYLSAAVIIVFLSVNYFLYNFPSLHFTYKYLFVNFFFIFIVFFLLCALVLGGWWAYQEVNWGGWWNWDLIELINLLLFFVILFSFHLTYFIWYNQFVFFSIKVFYIFLFLFYISRSNIMFSIHSFIQDQALLGYLYFFVFFINCTKNINFFFFFFKHFNFILATYWLVLNGFFFSIYLFFFQLLSNIFEYAFLLYWWLAIIFIYWINAQKNFLIFFFLIFFFYRYLNL